MFVVLRFHMVDAFVTNPKMINETTSTWKRNAVRKLVVILFAQQSKEWAWEGP